MLYLSLPMCVWLACAKCIAEAQAFYCVTGEHQLGLCCQGSEIELQGVQAAVAVAPLQPVVSAPVSALDCGFVTGRAVQCRDGAEEWRDGVIGNVNPLKVIPEGWDDAYKWDEVRLHSVASTISSRILDREQQ